VTLVEALEDPALFGQLAPFRNLDSWTRWLAFLRALFALPLSEAEHAVYAHHTGRETPPAVLPSEAYVCAGRRSGKTYMAALIATYLATFLSPLTANRRNLNRTSAR